MRFIASLLRNNYSDPMLATMREYLCNAIDASPNGEKVSVTLPTRLDQNFYIRDYGSGLSEEEMFGLFTSYGESTKRGSNEKIGAFGIGKVSALSYVDSFMIISFYNGEKITYVMRIDDQNDTSLVKLSSEFTEERNGLMIQVPIPIHDVTLFQEKFIFSFFLLKDKIDLKNQIFPIFVEEKNEVFTRIHNLDHEKLDELSDNFSQFATCSTFSKMLNSAYVEMGGILYLINNEDIVNYPAFSAEGIIYHAEIGEFKVHHSRETLEYNEKTKEGLAEASQKIFEEIYSSFENSFNDLKSLWEATCFVNEIDEFIENIFSSSYYRRGFEPMQIREFIDFPKFAFPEFNGQVPSRNVFNEKDVNDIYSVENFTEDSVKLVKISKNHFDKFLLPRRKNSECYSIFIVDDCPSPRSIKNRISYSGLNKDSDNIFLIKTNSPALIERAKAFQSENVYLLSDLPRRPVVHTNRSKAKTKPSAVNKGSVLLFDNNKDRVDSYTDHWKTHDIENPDQGTYYYVRCYMNFPMYVNKQEKMFDFPSNLAEIINFLNRDSDRSSPIKVYGVKNNQIEKFKEKSNWIPFEDVFKKMMVESPSVKKAFKHTAIDDTFSERSIGLNDFRKFNNGDSYLLEIAKKCANQNSIIDDFIEVMDNFENVSNWEYNKCIFSIPTIKKDNQYISFKEYLKNPVSNYHECNVINSFFDTYPMIANICAFGRYHISDKILSDCVEYLKRW